MKKLFENKSELQRMLIIGALVGLVISLLFLLGLIFGKIGFFIGALVGTGIELINIILFYKGSEAALKTTMASSFLIAYFTRMVVFLVGIIFLLVMDYILGLPAFKLSWVGAIVAYTPMQLVLVLSMKKDGKNPINISEDK